MFGVSHGQFIKKNYVSVEQGIQQNKEFKETLSSENCNNMKHIVTFYVNNA